MATKLQTIADTRRVLKEKVSSIYPGAEAGAVVTYLLEHITGLTPLRQLQEGTRTLSREESALLAEASSQLLEGCPVQYITGYSWFSDRRIGVNRSVLIPRQETEELVVRAASIAGDDFGGTIIDLCTGSGAIALSLALDLPEAEVWATDISVAALRVAAANSDRYGAGIKLIESDLLSEDFTPLPPAEIIVSNPPYVSLSEKRHMAENVTRYEPPGALFVPDSDPLLFYRPLLKAIEVLLVPGGYFCFEINEAMGREAEALFKKDFITNCSVWNDINGKERFIEGFRRG